MQNRVEVSHKNKGYLNLIFYLAQLGKEGLEVHTVLQGLSGGTLNYWTIGQGIAEGDADFDHGDATALHGEDDIGCAL